MVADGLVVVNGPEDDLPEWDAVDWRAAEEDVRRLRQRIFAASRDGDLKRVRNLDPPGMSVGAERQRCLIQSSDLVVPRDVQGRPLA